MSERPGFDERRRGTTNIVALLDQLLPDERILNDCYAVLREGAEDGMTEIELGAEWRPIPVSAPIVVVTKAFFNQRFNTGFGTSYRAQVAIGDVVETDIGTVDAGFCFATLYYNDERHLITIDFHVFLR